MSEYPARILIVDDDPSARDIVRRRLEMEGHEVVLAENGWQALERIEQDQPDLVVLDMMMPGLDGIGVIKRVRSNPAQVSIPILMLTARDRAIDKQFGLEAGADDYLGKPFEFAELVARIHALLRRARGWSVPGDAVKRGHVVTFVGSKGGVGTTTIATSVAVALARNGTTTILAELTNWGGPAATLLGLTARRRVDRLPLSKPEIVTATMVANTLIDHGSGLKLLAGRVRDTDPVTEAAADALIEAVRRCAEVIVLDIDEEPNPLTRAACRVASQVWVVTEPEPTSVERAAALIDHFDENGVSRRRIGIVVNQTNAAMAVTAAEIALATGIAPTHSLPAMPNACYAAATRGVPIVDLAAQLPAAQAFAAFARAIAGHPGSVQRPDVNLAASAAQPLGTG